MISFNEAFGWSCVFVGFLTGGLIGLRFEIEHWRGGYASLQRRLMRLAHISLVALGILNIEFAHTLHHQHLPPQIADAASVLLIVGALTMPLACFLTAWNVKWKPLFGVPVLSLLLGVSLVIYGILQP